MPRGFDLIGQSSEHNEVQDARFIRHKYIGKADKDDVLAFYRRQMPLVRWTPVGEDRVGGRYTLRFERGDETCSVEIGDGDWLRRVKIDVAIAPEPD